jgi:hypothetical protein
VDEQGGGDGHISGCENPRGLDRRKRGVVEKSGLRWFAGETDVRICVGCRCSVEEGGRGRKMCQ